MKKTIKSSLISCLFVTLVVFSAFFVGCGSLTDFLDNLKSGYSVYFVDSTITLEADGKAVSGNITVPAGKTVSSARSTA